MLKIMLEETDGSLVELQDTDATVKDSREARELLKKIGQDGATYQVIKVHDRIQVRETRRVEFTQLDLSGMAKA